MKRDDILNVFAELAQSQGFYGRLLRDLMEMKDEDPELYERVMTHWEEQDFHDALDLILYIEC